MRLVFAGTPRAAIPSLEALEATSHEIVAVITRPDAPIGRRRVITPSPVAQVAHALGIPVIKTSRFDQSLTEQIVDLHAELGVVVAYGALVPPALLAALPHGWVNTHFSLLPRWRGAAPVQHAIMAGDPLTGVTVFALEAGLDSGPILATMTVEPGPDETAGELLDRLAHESPALLVSVVDAIESGTSTPVPQVGDTTYAPKLDASDGRIDWNRSLEDVYNQIRGVTPEPGAATFLESGRLGIVAARRVDDALAVPVGVITRQARRILVGTRTSPIELLTVHPAGRQPMRAMDWWNGVKNDEVKTQ